MMLQKHILDTSLEDSQPCTLLLQERRVRQGTETTFSIGYRELAGAAMKPIILNGHDLDKAFQRGANRIASTFHQILSGPITLEKGTVLLGSNIGVSQKHNVNFSHF